MSCVLQKLRLDGQQVEETPQGSASQTLRGPASLIGGVHRLIFGNN